MTDKMAPGFGFRTDLLMSEVLRSRRGLTLSAEVIPPRNGQGDVVMREIEALIAAGAEFLSVTRGAGGSLRAGSLPIAQTIKERYGVPCIAHFTCRDLTPEEVENQLVDHAYFGIRNILALRGDPPLARPDWQPKEGSYAYAYELIGQIARLNRGEYLTRAGAATEFCIGAAAYPEHPVGSEAVEFFRLKVESGASYGITQMVFDPEIYASYVERLAAAGVVVPLLVGTRVLASREQAARMASRFFCSVPKWLLKLLPSESEPDFKNGAYREQSLDAFMQLAQKFQSVGAPGLHLFVLGDTVGTGEVIKRLRT